MKTPLIILSMIVARSASASILMFDFGPTPSPQQSGLDNSPYHSVYPVTGTVWNPVQTADIAPGALKYADGTTAALIGLATGFSTTSTTINPATSTPGNTLAGGASYTEGIYEGVTPPSRSALFNTTANSNLGVQITGLAAGIYEVFIHSRNTNSSQTYTQTNYVGAGNSGAFDFSTYASQVISYTSTGSTASWVAEGAAGENYTRFQVTITAGQAINIGIVGQGDNHRGFINTLQIAPIPEPSQSLLIFVSLLPVFCHRRRTV
jgi:hypothetical protein